MATKIKTVYLDTNGDMLKSRIVAYPNGADDQDFEEVLLSDSEKHEEVLLDLHSELRDEDQIPY